MQNPGKNALGGNCMGGGSQGKKGEAQYAHAVPPSLNAGTMVVLKQRAYFSAWRIVFEVPSSDVGEAGLPCGLVTGGFLPGHSSRLGMARGRVTGRPKGNH
jgi:hypothetical protein